MEIKKKKISEIIINPKYAELAPPLTQIEYNEIKESIKNEGQMDPIILNQNNVCLDGHHRIKMCQELGIDPLVTHRYFENELQELLFIKDRTRLRRNLNRFGLIELELKTKAELQKIAKENMSLAGKGVPIGTPLGRIDQEIGKRTGVGKNTVRRVEKILEKADNENVEKLRAGTKTINEVFSDVQAEEKKQELIKRMEQRAQNLDEKTLEEYEERFQPIHGDAIEECRKLKTKGVSVALVFTDPVYLETHLNSYDELAEIACMLLEPGGSLVMYCPQIHLDEIFRRMRKYKDLKYYWQIWNNQEETTQTHARPIYIDGKPFLWFVKGKLDRKTMTPLHDVIYSRKPDKTLHKWAQSPVEAEYIIKNLTLFEDQTVLDPYMGSGTTGIACVRQGRKFIGIESDPEHKGYYTNAVLAIKQEVLKSKFSKYFFEIVNKFIQEGTGKRVEFNAVRLHFRDTKKLKEFRDTMPLYMD